MQNILLGVLTFTCIFSSRLEAIGHSGVLETCTKQMTGLTGRQELTPPVQSIAAPQITPIDAFDVLRKKEVLENPHELMSLLRNSRHDGEATISALIFQWKGQRKILFWDTANPRTDPAIHHSFVSKTLRAERSDTRLIHAARFVITPSQMDSGLLKISFLPSTNSISLGESNESLESPSIVHMTEVLHAMRENGIPTSVDAKIRFGGKYEGFLGTSGTMTVNEFDLRTARIRSRLP